MPTNTPNYNLVKPLVTENYDIAKVTNENADILDGAIHDLDLGKQALPTVEKVTPVDTDMVVLLDSADIDTPKKWSWLNIKASLKTYFDNIYQTILVSGTNIKTVNGETLLGSGNLSTDWNLINATLTYASADSPTFVANTSVDLTSVISVGMKLKLTQTTVKYFIVTAITSTTITLYGGTDYTLANASITLPYFSSMKAPFGFPMDTNKWSVIFTDVTSRSQANPTQAVWYNLGSLSFSLPIGAWNLRQNLLSAVLVTTGKTATILTTISTTNNSQPLPQFTLKFGGYTSLETDVVMNLVYDGLVLSSKTTYYLLAMTDLAGISGIYFLNNQSTLTIKAVCAYL